jgi:hypothetical protein
VSRPGGNDEVVVANIRFRRLNDSLLQIEAGNLGHEDFHVLIGAKNRTNRRGNLRWRKTGGGYLVEKRLKCVMVLSIDDGDLYGGFGQSARGVQASESRANDYHSGCRFVCHLAVTAQPL